MRGTFKFEVTTAKAIAIQAENWQLALGMGFVSPEVVQMQRIQNGTLAAILDLYQLDRFCSCRFMRSSSECGGLWESV